MLDRCVVILNTGAGNSTSEKRTEIELAFRDAGMLVEIREIADQAQVDAQIQAAVESDAEVLVAAGGDGTVSAVASRLVGSEKALGVLPLGTLNNFSKDLQIPQDLAGAVGVIAAGRTAEIDVGEVNGKCFINNSSVGLYPRIVRKRNQQQHLGWGKWWAALWAVWRFFLLSPFVKVKLTLNGNELLRKTPFVFVGNNDYEMDLYNIGRRLKMDEGNLSIYLLHHNGRWGLFLLVLHTIFGRLKQNKDFEEFRAAELTLHSQRRRTLVALDGEVTLMNYPLEYRVRPKALRVLAPKQG